MPVPPAVGFLGVAKETVKGTAVAATNYPAIALGRVGYDMLMQVDDTGSRGSMIDGPFDQLAGPLYGMYDIPDSPAFADTVPWGVLGVLGDVTVDVATRVSSADGNTTNATPSITSATAAFTQRDVGKPISGTNVPAGAWIIAVASATAATMSANATGTGATSAFTIGTASVNAHSGSVKNSTDGQPASLTLTDFYGLTGGTPARQFAGAQVQKVSVKFTAEGLLVYSASFVSFASATVAKPTSAWTAVTPHVASPDGSLLLASGTTLSQLLLSAELNFTRTVKPIHTADGTPAPYKIWVGPIAVDGKLSFVMEDDTEYLRYLNNSKPRVDLDFRHGSGVNTVASHFALSKCNYKMAKPNHTAEYAVYDAEFQGLPNSTDAGASGGFSQVRATFLNALATGTFQ